MEVVVGGEGRVAEVAGESMMGGDSELLPYPKPLLTTSSILSVVRRRQLCYGLLR